MALSVESTEIVEHFEWLTEECKKSPLEKMADIGDVMIYLTEQNLIA